MNMTALLCRAAGNLAPQAFALVRWTGGLSLVLLSACATLSLPRVEPPIKAESFTDEGALRDASKGFPVAFYANPGQKPEVLEVDGGLGSTQLHAAQWTTELARQLNRAVAKLGRFDDRFAPFSQQIFAHEVTDGDMRFPWREPASFAADVERVRLVRLHTLTVTARAETGGMSAAGTIEASLPNGWGHIYACEVAPGPNWQQRLFTCLGEKVVGDTAFWTAVATIP